jgi:hypothetical protein
MYRCFSNQSVEQPDRRARKLKRNPKSKLLSIGRKTIKKRMRAKLLAIKIELRKKMHDPESLA